MSLVLSLTRRAAFIPSAAALLLMLGAPSVSAGPTPGPWVPLFKGIDHAVGTNTPGVSGNFSELQVAHCVRVDLTDPDVQLFTTPRASSYAVDSRETLTLSVPDFLQKYHLQIVADSNFYNASSGGADPDSEGISCEVYGVQVSQGVVVSPATSEGDNRYATLMFTTNKAPIFDFVNRPPGTNLTGIYTAITGYYPIVSNGVNIGAASIAAYPDSFIHEDQPRTAYGISQDKRYLYMMTIDGRQSGYSDGAIDSETAYWMLKFGAWNAINMDGGGSTALYAADSTGSPVGLNHSSYLSAYQRERYIGSHLGVFAKPLPGFFNDVTPLPDDTAATITWTTVDPATTQLEYGASTNYTLTTTLVSTLTTNHAVLLTNLSPGVGYYFAAMGKIGTTAYVSSNFFFVTSNYATTNAIFDLTQNWTFAYLDLDGVNWTAPGYDDSSWSGPGSGVLWADTRGPDPMGDIPVALLTEMPTDASSGYPYPTYYVRTHFDFTNSTAGATLLLGVWVDDGAVLYLNGTEIYRICMAAAPTPIVYTALATGYVCSTGDASCPTNFGISGTLITNLVTGDNVLAAEVHNYSARSPDITFGMSLDATVPYAVEPELSLVNSNGVALLSWTRGGFTLQQASTPSGPWSNVAGTAFVSPYAAPYTGTARFFRLSK